MPGLATKTICLTTLVALSCSTAAQTIRLVTTSYPPFAYEECGRHRGLAIALVKEAFARMGQEVHIALYPFPRALAQFRSGQVDGIFPFAKKDERQAYTRYPQETLLSNPSVLFVRRDSRISFDGDFAKLRHFTFGMQRQTDQGEAFTQALQRYQLKIEEAPDQEHNVRKLMEGRFDIGVGPEAVVTYSARKLQLSNRIRLLQPAISKGDVYVGFATQRDYRAVMQQLDNSMRAMRNDGSYQRISAEYDAAGIANCDQKP